MKFLIGFIVWIVLSFWFAMSFGRFMAGVRDREIELKRKEWGDFDYYDW